MAGTRLYIQTSFSLLLFLIYFSAWIKIKRENNDIFIQSKNTRSHVLTNINYKLIPQRSWLSNIFQVNQYEKRGFERLYKEFTILHEEEGKNHYDGMPFSIYFIIIDDDSDKLRTFASDLKIAIEKRNKLSIEGCNHQHYNTFIELLDSKTTDNGDVHSVITRMQQKHSSFSEFPIILHSSSNNDLVDGSKSDDTKIEIDVESGVVILSIIASKNEEEINELSQKIDSIANILFSDILPQKNFHENKINDLPLSLQPKNLSIQITLLHQLPITSSSSKNGILNVGYLLNDLAHDKFLPMLLKNSFLSPSSSDIEISCNVGSISSSSSLFSTSNNNETIIDEMTAYKWFSHDPFLQQQQRRKRNKAFLSNVLHFVIIIPSKENNNPIYFSNQIERRDSSYNASPELGVAYDIPNKGGIYLLNHNDNDDTTTMDVEITKALSSFMYIIRESTRSVLPQDVAVKHNRRKETYHDLNIHITPATKYHSSFFTPWEIKRLYHFLVPIYYKDILEKFGLLMNLLHKNTSIEITQENIHKIEECLDALKFVKDTMTSKNVTSSKAKDTTCNVLSKTNNITDSTSASCAPLVNHHQLIKHALDSLESLLHDSTLMEAQNTPKEHLFAVLTPFLLPLLLPIFLGFVQEIKRYNDKKKKKKESEEDKQEEQTEKINTEAVEVCPGKKEE